MPRWLRASVRAERFWTPEPRNAERDRWERRAAVEVEDVGRDAVSMVVRGEDVNLLDGPNVSYAAIVGRLHTGDEVLVLGMDGDWVEVRTPTGATGWLPLAKSLMAIDGRRAAAAAELAQAPEVRRPAKRSRSGSSAKRRPAPSS